MRRVRKEEVQPYLAQKPDGLRYCLDCWKDWMLSDDRDLSAARMKLRSRDENDRESGYESNPFDDQRKADMKIGEATNAMIDDLKPAWRWSLYRMCGITTQWRFPQLDFTLVVVDAENALREKLQKNIDTATLFY